MNIESIGPAIKRKTSTWLMIWGILIFVCGILAIAFPATFPVGIAIVLGCLILVAGIAHVIFAFHTRSIGGFLWHILLGPLYGITALSLLANPLLGVVSLALLLALFLLIEGVLELALYFCIRRLQHSVWVSVDGIGTLILGILMVTKWPPDFPEIIAILIGISLMLSGLSRVMLSLAVRALTPA
jgi:uncharacterized membrane protein HdeD (DUF308 family)